MTSFFNSFKIFLGSYRQEYPSKTNTFCSSFISFKAIFIKSWIISIMLFLYKFKLIFSIKLSVFNLSVNKE